MMHKRYGPPAQQMPRHPRLARAIALLQAVGADNHPHTHGRSLLGHLVGTAQLLIAWNAPIATVLAGLCHSIYGTNAFRPVSLPRHQRQRLRNAIGPRAEHIVWLFANLRRPATLERAMRSHRTLVRQRSGRTRHCRLDDLQQLFVLECANLADQAPRRQQLSELRALAKRAAPQLRNMHAGLDRFVRQAAR
ncbi:DUF6817 domain-containing protein [Viridibacterium curvum]|uniref:DUF6817 domain-containing protein n=1 Tax=Viridibacterium curvum TaxID=1101404 RepID=A0ABP9QZX7_9RHOO